MCTACHCRHEPCAPPSNTAGFGHPRRCFPVDSQPHIGGRRCHVPLMPSEVVRAGVSSLATAGSSLAAFTGIVPVQRQSKRVSKRHATAIAAAVAADEAPEAVPTLTPATVGLVSATRARPGAPRVGLVVA